MKRMKRPTYAYTRTEYKGISERLAMASLAFSKTWETSTREHGLRTGLGTYMHSARFISKTEGWEAYLTWSDDSKRVNLKDPATRKGIAEAIEGARNRWYDDKFKINKELLAIVARVALKEAA